MGDRGSSARRSRKPVAPTMATVSPFLRANRPQNLSMPENQAVPSFGNANAIPTAITVRPASINAGETPGVEEVAKIIYECLDRGPVLNFRGIPGLRYWISLGRSRDRMRRWVWRDRIRHGIRLRQPYLAIGVEVN